MLNESAFDQMKDGVMIINTSRGELLVRFGIEIRSATV
ncbi:D-lactate dehydrogenase [Vibrio cholerae]|nr:D-lactate dehydrogenase [Vibrio cholerae]